MAAGFISIEYRAMLCNSAFMVFDIRLLKKQQVIDTAMTTDIFKPFYAERANEKSHGYSHYSMPSTAAR